MKYLDKGFYKQLLRSNQFRVCAVYQWQPTVKCYTVQPATCFYQSRRAASPHYKFAPRLRHLSVGKSRGRRGFSVERSGAKRARRGAARLMSLAHDVIGSGAREAALIGVKKINAYRTQKLQTAMSLHNSTTGTDCMCICVQV